MVGTAALAETVLYGAGCPCRITGSNMRHILNSVSMKTGQMTDICISEWTKMRPDGFYSDDIEDAEKAVNTVSRQNVLHHNLSPILSQGNKNTNRYNRQKTKTFSVG